jgi:chromosome segregation ATPase
MNDSTFARNVNGISDAFGKVQTQLKETEEKLLKAKKMAQDANTINEQLTKSAAEKDTEIERVRKELELMKQERLRNEAQEKENRRLQEQLLKEAKREAETKAQEKFIEELSKLDIEKHQEIRDRIESVTKEAQNERQTLIQQINEVHDREMQEFKTQRKAEIDKLFAERSSLRDENTRLAIQCATSKSVETQGKFAELLKQDAELRSKYDDAIEKNISLELSLSKIMSEAHNLQKELEEKKKCVGEQETTIKTLKQKIKSYRSESDEQEGRIQSLSADVMNLNSQIQEGELKLIELEKTIENNENELSYYKNETESLSLNLEKTRKKLSEATINYNQLEDENKSKSIELATVQSELSLNQATIEHLKEAQLKKEESSDLIMRTVSEIDRRYNEIALKSNGNEATELKEIQKKMDELKLAVENNEFKITIDTTMDFPRGKSKKAPKQASSKITSKLNGFD